MTKKDRVLELRRKGFSIKEIAQILDYTITEVCEIIYEQNSLDKESDKD